MKCLAVVILFLSSLVMAQDPTVMSPPMPPEAVAQHEDRPQAPTFAPSPEQDKPTLPTRDPVRASLHSATLILSGTPSPGVTAYFYYRGTVKGGPYTKLSLGCTFGNPPTPCVDGTVTPGSTYYYVATAFCQSCTTQESLQSPEATAVIPITTGGINPPTNLSAKQISQNPAVVSITWTPATGNTNIKWQLVYRQVGCTGVWNKQKELKLPASSWTQSGDKKGKKYCYAATEVTKAGESPKSDIAIIVID